MKIEKRREKTEPSKLAKELALLELFLWENLGAGFFISQLLSYLNVSRKTLFRYIADLNNAFFGGRLWPSTMPIPRDKLWFDLDTCVDEDAVYCFDAHDFISLDEALSNPNFSENEKQHILRLRRLADLFEMDEAKNYYISNYNEDYMGNEMDIEDSFDDSNSSFLRPNVVLAELKKEGILLNKRTLYRDFDEMKDAMKIFSKHFDYM